MFVDLDFRYFVCVACKALDIWCVVFGFDFKKKIPQNMCMKRALEEDML